MDRLAKSQAPVAAAASVTASRKRAEFRKRPSDGEVANRVIGLVVGWPDFEGKMVGALAKASGTDLNEAGPAERRPAPDAFQIHLGHTELLQKEEQGLTKEFGSPSSGELIETAADAPDS